MHRNDELTDVACAAWLEALLPDHKCGLYLSHNEHRNYHQTVAEWEAEYGRADLWVSAEERECAVQTGEVWMLQWYPDTSVGFYRIAASSLAALLAAVPRP